VIILRIRAFIAGNYMFLCCPSAQINQLASLTAEWAPWIFRRVFDRTLTGRTRRGHVNKRSWVGRLLPQVWRADALTG
jgi:hypothetical protein